MNQKNSVMICGFGVSGKAAARLAGYLEKHIVLVDENNSREMRDQAAEIKKQYPCEMELYFSWTPEITLPRCETAVMSPGIRRGTPLFQTAEQSAGKVISELEFAFSHITCPIAAITGTNGKNTTVTLLYDLVPALGYKHDGTDHRAPQGVRNPRGVRRKHRARPQRLRDRSAGTARQIPCRRSQLFPDRYDLEVSGMPRRNPQHRQRPYRSSRRHGRLCGNQIPHLRKLSGSSAGNTDHQQQSHGLQKPLPSPGAPHDHIFRNRSTGGFHP